MDARANCLAGLTDHQLLEIYENLVFARMVEETMVEMFARGQIPTFVHSGLGEEAPGVGAIYALRSDDYLVASHRPQIPNFVLKGADLNKLIAEMLGKATGYCKGKGGIMHPAMYEVGCIGQLGMIGYNLPLATGAALSIKMRGTDQVCLNIFGDGASGQGTFHESLNMASVWKLPVIFLCVNNQFAITTRSRDVFPARIGDRAVAYAIPGATIDGTDVIAVYEATRAAVNRARNGEGPSLIEAVTYRWMEHAEGLEKFIGNHPYRRKEECEEARQEKDALKLFQDKLVSQGILTQVTIDAIAERLHKKIDGAIEFGRRSPSPKPEEAFEGVFTNI